MELTMYQGATYLTFRELSFFPGASNTKKIKYLYEKSVIFFNFYKHLLLESADYLFKETWPPPLTTKVKLFFPKWRKVLFPLGLPGKW